MISQLQLTVDANEIQVPIADNIFELFGALAITYSDAKQQPLFELAPSETKLWNESRITALFDANTNVEQLFLKISQII